MKLFLSTLLASFAVTLSLQAIPSNLGESLREFEAIIDSPLIQSVIGPEEFIFEIERRTHNLTDTTVYYEIKTDIPGSSSSADIGVQVAGIDGDSAVMKSSNHNRHYKVRLRLTPNPMIGPVIIEVVSIKRISEHHSHSVILEEDASK